MQINFEEIDSYIKHEFYYEAHETEFDIKEPSPNYASINGFIKQSDEILQDNIRNLILSKQLDEAEVYKKADVDRNLFSKIRTQPYDNANNGGQPETPPQPTEDLVLAAENEYGIAYIYLPEADETNSANSINDRGKPLKRSDAEYRLELVKTVTRKSTVVDTISTHGNFAGFGNLCNNLKVYKIFVSRNTRETEFYISSNGICLQCSLIL